MCLAVPAAQAYAVLMSSSNQSLISVATTGRVNHWILGNTSHSRARS